MGPVCQPKTTTISPAIRAAMSSILMRHKQKLEYRIQVYQWKDNGDFQIKKLPEYWLHVTIPSIIGICCVILMTLACTKPHSPLCLICSDNFGKKDKISKPLA